jgi:hypothetical protein
LTCLDQPKGRIYLAQPTYSSGTPDSHAAFWNGALRPDSRWHGRVNKIFGGRSLLANTFNMFWCHALNLQLEARPERWEVEEISVQDGACLTHAETCKPEQWVVKNKELARRSGRVFASEEEARALIPALAEENDISYFAMLHDDVTPAQGWLDQLIDDLEESGADVMAAVVPIKDQLGLTSTAIDDPDDPFNVFRRITMAELMRLPEVFTAADCGYPDRFLLANTGCWVCRFDRDWRFHVRFTIDDQIVLKDGRYCAEVAPEDWNFSRDVQHLGGKVACTRRVKVAHAGKIDFTNDHVWGEWKHDHAFEHKFGGPDAVGILEPKPSKVEEYEIRPWSGAEVIPLDTENTDRLIAEDEARHNGDLMKQEMERRLAHEVKINRPDAVETTTA